MCDIYCNPLKRLFGHFHEHVRLCNCCCILIVVVQIMLFLVVVYFVNCSFTAFLRPNIWDTVSMCVFDYVRVCVSVSQRYVTSAKIQLSCIASYIFDCYIANRNWNKIRAVVCIGSLLLLLEVAIFRSEIPFTWIDVYDTHATLTILTVVYFVWRPLFMIFRPNVNLH